MSKPKLSELLKQEKLEEKSKIISSSKKDFKRKSSSETKIISPKKDISILNEENLILFIKQTNETKKYEMKHRFYDASAREISNLVEKLIKEGKLKRNKNGWISLVKEVD